jgi:hypothetical protein
MLIFIFIKKTKQRCFDLFFLQNKNGLRVMFWMVQARSIRSADQLGFFLLRQPYFVFLFFIQPESVRTSKQPNLKSTY